MAETKYHFKREGNHIKLSSQKEQPQPNIQKMKGSIWSKIGSLFGLLFSGLIALLGFLIATPFFILNVLWNRVTMFIGLSIFWMFVGIIYYGLILNYEMDTNLIFNNTSLPILLIVALLGAIMATIGQIKE